MAHHWQYLFICLLGNYLLGTCPGSSLRDPKDKDDKILSWVLMRSRRKIKPRVPREAQWDWVGELDRGTF